MTASHRDPTTPEIRNEFVHAVGTIFECLGRALICLDPSFRIVHVSGSLDALTGEGTGAAILGRPAEEVLGPELFGEGSPLRQALSDGERREGWGASLRIEGASSRLLSLTAAPIHVESTLCDPRVASFLVLRAAEDPSESATAMPTAFSGMVARSAAMLQIFRLIENLSESEATTLISGESGTGKELIARAIHLHSPRRGGPWVAVNCGALPGDLLESELFGHVRGAFTGAIRDRVGRFEKAEGGTLFLDEVGDLSLPLQVKLLRVLQERSYERVGESESRRTDARIIAATNRDLPRAILEATFREDLYYRLRVVPLEIPPLVQRREDIEPLTRHLLARVCARHGRSVFLGPDALKVLLAYPWPGNVRELENALEFAVSVTRRQTIHRQDLPAEIQEGRPTMAAPRPSTPAPAAVEPTDERDRLRAALEENRWNRDQTARALGISRTTLWRRMREFRLVETGRIVS